jgi:hypothetical protein
MPVLLFGPSAEIRLAEEGSFLVPLGNIYEVLTGNTSVKPEKGARL